MEKITFIISLTLILIVALGTVNANYDLNNLSSDWDDDSDLSITANDLDDLDDDSDDSDSDSDDEDEEDSDSDDEDEEDSDSDDEDDWDDDYDYGSEAGELNKDFHITAFDSSDLIATSNFIPKALSVASGASAFGGSDDGDSLGDGSDDDLDDDLGEGSDSDDDLGEGSDSDDDLDDGSEDDSDSEDTETSGADDDLDGNVPMATSYYAAGDDAINSSDESSSDNAQIDLDGLITGHPILMLILSLFALFIIPLNKR